ncbi:hypothetical protein GQ457_08G013120 [Hibiscus cannabinus]
MCLSGDSKDGQSFGIALQDSRRGPPNTTASSPPFAAVRRRPPPSAAAPEYMQMEGLVRDIYIYIYGTWRCEGGWAVVSGGDVRRWCQAVAVMGSELVAAARISS